MEKTFSLSKKEYLEVIDYIKEKHKNQYRRFTLTPYWVHPIRVASLVLKYKESFKIDELVIASLCHDLVEDTPTTLEEVKTRYGELVSSLVEELTSDKKLQEEKGKSVYLSEKMITMSSWGLVIKLCDRLDNIMDFSFANVEFIEKYTKETMYIIQELKSKRELSNTHYRIINDIMVYLQIYYPI